MLREETERIVTSHIRDRENRAKDQVPPPFHALVFPRYCTYIHTHAHECAAAVRGSKNISGIYCKINMHYVVAC